MPLNPTRLRTMVAGWLNDTCEIRAKGTAPVFDIEDGYDTDEGDVVYSGKCRLRAASGPQVVAAGEGLVTLHGQTLYLPWDTGDIEVDQLVTMITSNSPYAEGRTYRIKTVTSGSDAEALKCEVEDVLDVAQWEESGS